MESKTPNGSNEDAGRSEGAFWSSLRPGARAETHRGELIGEVIAVDADAMTVRDPVEQRELLIPRGVCEPGPVRAGSREQVVRLRARALRSVGTGPERFVRRSNPADEWVAEQTAPERAFTVEGDDGPLDARRVTSDGAALVADAEDVGRDETSVPLEMRSIPARGRAREAAGTGIDVGIGGRDRPSAHALTPAMAGPLMAHPPEAPPARSEPAAPRAGERGREQPGVNAPASQQSAQRADRTPRPRSDMDKQWLLRWTVRSMLPRLARRLGLRSTEIWALFGLMRIARHLDERIGRSRRRAHAHAN